MRPQRFRLRRVRLEPLLPRHLEFVYSMFADENVAWRYRFRGHIPSPDALAARLWDGVAVQKLVVDVEREAMAGMVSLYNHNVRSATAYIAAVAHPEYEGMGLVAEGAASLLDYGFQALGLRKIYAEVLGFNVEQFRTLSRIAEEEGRLREHELQDGKYWDMITYAIYREAWDRMLDDPVATLALGP